MDNTFQLNNDTSDARFRNIGLVPTEFFDELFADQDAYENEDAYFEELFGPCPPPTGPFDDQTAINLFNSGNYKDICNCVDFLPGTWAALYYKGICYVYGLGPYGCDSYYGNMYLCQAFPHVKAAAESGSPDAQNAFGVMFEQGFGTKADIGEAIAWYTKASASGSAKAKSNLARLMLDGTGCEKDIPKAIETYKSAAEANYDGALFTLAQIYAEGRYVKPDREAAAHWLLKAEEARQAEAMKILLACGKDRSTARINIELLIHLREKQRPGNIRSAVSFSVCLRTDLPDKPTPPEATTDDAWILDKAKPGAALPPLATRSALKTPDLERANPSFAALLIKAVRDHFGGDAPVVYQAAGISRKTYSAIIGNELRPVSKRTALAFAFALRLPIEEFESMLKAAGFALSPALLEDMIFKACLECGIYDLGKISEILEAHGAKPFVPQEEQE